MDNNANTVGETKSNLHIPNVVRSLPEDEVWTELSDKFREMAHRYKDGEFDYRTVWDWFQQQQKDYKLERL